MSGQVDESFDYYESAEYNEAPMDVAGEANSAVNEPASFTSKSISNNSNAAKRFKIKAEMMPQQPIVLLVQAERCLNPFLTRRRLQVMIQKPKMVAAAKARGLTAGGAAGGYPRCH